MSKSALKRTKFRSLLSSVAHEIRTFRFQKSLEESFVSSKEEQDIVSEVNNRGFCVIENAFSKEWCNRAIQETDRLLIEYHDQIWIDDQRSDHRIFGANHLSDLIQEFYINEFILKIVQTYEGTKVKDGFTLGSKLMYKEENIGSGGGWHRDNPYGKQTKAIVYLTDVDEGNGPFEYIQGSHKSLDVLKKQFGYNFDMHKNRFEDSQLEEIIESNPSKLKTLTAKAGTLIFVDTRGIHHGRPIKSGTRYALTNYFWFHSDIPKHMNKVVIRK